MLKHLIGWSILVILLFQHPGVSAANGDYRTKASGNWNDPSIWQVYQSGWQNATSFPTYLNGSIDILNGHSVTITADIILDQVDINYGGTVTLNNGITLTLYNGSGTDLSQDGTLYIYGNLTDNGSITSSATTYVYGTLDINGSMTVSGVMYINGTLQLDGSASVSGTMNVNGTVNAYDAFTISGSLYFYDGSHYKHYRNGGALPDGVWNSGSSCEIYGCTSSYVTNLNQDFWNFTWNCTGQNDFFNLGTFGEVHGNFTLESTGTGVIELTQSGSVNWTIDGNYVQNGGTFDPAYTSGHDTIIIGGNFTFGGGTISCPGSGSCTFRFNKNGATQTYAKSGGNYYQRINFEVTNGSTLDMGSSIIDNSSGGYFLLAAGSGLKTMHTQGVSTTANTGCVQVTGTKTYSNSANYFYYYNGSQSSGNGFQTTQNGTVTVGSLSNATTLSLTNGSVAINNKLTLTSSASANSSISGTITFGSNAILEYKGGAGQTATSAEWPSSAGPPNVIINNSNGISLPSSFGRTITGTLYLTSGALTIGPNLLTLNSASISKTSGSITGGSGSSLSFTGSGSTSLPGVLNGLSTLTLNRSGATITMTGNLSVIDSLILSNGAFALSGGVISYGSGGTLKYSGGSGQTTANAEFPASGGPRNLVIKNASGVTLHAGRSLDGTLYLSNGALSIGSGNTLTLNRDINIGSGSLTGGSSSNLTIGDYSSPITLPAISGGLNNLTVNRPAGTSLGASLTIAATLTLSAGALSIGSTTLTLNGQLSKTSGSLNGGASSNIIAGGGNAISLDLPQVTLNNLTMNRPAGGIRQTGNITVSGTMTVSGGVLNNNGWTFAYGSSGTLKYNGSLSQTTSGSEFPVASGPFNLFIDNAISVGLHADRAIAGTLTLNSGQFSIGAHTLTLNGSITQNSGASLSGGASSNIIFGENGSGTSLPAVELNNLTIHRSGGVVLGGNVTTGGTLTLELGTLSLGSTTLTVNGALTQTSGALGGGASAKMIFGGGGGWTSLPAVTLFDLEINRPAGIKMSGLVTVGDNLTLTSGSFSIESNTLNVNGAITYAGGSLSGGNSSNLSFGGSGAGTNLQSVVLNNLTINRAAGIGLAGDVTTGGTLFLQSGSLSINSNTLTLNGGISNSSSPGLVGGSSSNITFGGTGSSTDLPSVSLHDLSINRAAGIALGGSVTVNGTLFLTSGDLAISSNTLTINGDVSYTSGLVGGSSSNLLFGGSGSAAVLKAISLNSLTLNRPAGLDLTDSVTVYGQFTLMNGQIRRNSFRLYGPAATLRYNYGTTQTTSEEELPGTGGPYSVMIDMMNNSDKMNLHADKTMRGDLVLTRGVLAIGAHTLTLDGMIIPGMGSLEGGITSNIVFEGSSGSTQLPQVIVNDLTINRSHGITMNGDVTVFGTLSLNAGPLAVNSFTLELDGGPVSGNQANLQTSTSSGLYFGGNATGITIPSAVTQLGRLRAANPNGIQMTTNLMVSTSVVVANYLVCGDKSIHGNASFYMASNSKLAVGHPLGISGTISLSGPKIIWSDTDFEFTGTVDQQTHFLPTMTPGTVRNLVISNSNNSVVSLTENMTFTGDVVIMPQSKFRIVPSIGCAIQGNLLMQPE